MKAWTLPILRNALKVLAGCALLAGAVLAGPALVEYAKLRFAPPPAPTWNDVARRLAEFQKEQPGLGAPPAVAAPGAPAIPARAAGK